MKQTNLFKLLFLCLLMFVIGCSKDTIEEINQPPVLTGDLPTLTTEKPSSITPTTTISGGEVKTDGGLSVTARGLCWSTSPNPTIELTTKSVNGFGIGSFSFGINKLTPATTYYIKAYATNAKGTAYGDEISFTTLKEPLPTITTSPVTEITSTTAKSGGEIINDSGLPIIEKGVCWSLEPKPTTEGSRAKDNTTTDGVFSINVSKLISEKTYYLRSYVINSAGTAYGNEITFTTLKSELPKLTTLATSEITDVSAISGGEITDDLGNEITERGVCWSLYPNPTISLPTKIKDSGTGLGSYSIHITNLSGSNTYYVRSYAINKLGTSYGDQLVFTTLSNL